VHQNISTPAIATCFEVRREETHCRFCRARLPDWRESMTPEDVRALRQTQRAPPAIMAVAFNGKVCI